MQIERIELVVPKTGSINSGNRLVHYGKGGHKQRPYRLGTAGPPAPRTSPFPGNERLRLPH
jgi:hypothetical protein